MNVSVRKLVYPVLQVLFLLIFCLGSNVFMTKVVRIISEDRQVSDLTGDITNMVSRTTEVSDRTLRIYSEALDFLTKDSWLSLVELRIYFVRDISSAEYKKDWQYLFRPTSARPSGTHDLSIIEDLDLGSVVVTDAKFIGKDGIIFEDQFFLRPRFSNTIEKTDEFGFGLVSALEDEIELSRESKSCLPVYWRAP